MVSPSSFPRTRQRPSPSRSLPWRGQRACQWHAAGWRPACAGSPAVLRCSWWAQDSDGPVREAREDTAVPSGESCPQCGLCRGTRRFALALSRTFLCPQFSEAELHHVPAWPPWPVPFCVSSAPEVCRCVSLAKSGTSPRHSCVSTVGFTSIWPVRPLWASWPLSAGQCAVLCP